jgi:CheY-like chemotaxis protein
MSRSLTSDLGHPALSEPDVSAGLEWLAAWMKEKHGLSVTLDCPGGIVLPVEEIRITLMQTVRELLFNVAKHAGVRAAEVAVDTSLPGRLQVTVSDTGTGFAADSSSVTGAKAGNAARGIGLFTARERLALTGGGIEIASAPGSGTRATVWVPIGPVAAGPVAAPAAGEPVTAPGGAVTGERIRVLLVDDHEVVRAGLAAQLRQHPDIEVVAEAADGPSALRLTGELRPEIVTMDVGLPGMSGIEAARLIRERYPETIVIGLSMFDDARQAERMRAAGAAVHLSKSASFGAVLAALRACARTSRAATDPRTTAATGLS